ncbi:MAG TPA: hypothetical protein DHV62_02160, partial [Elusimicrobia bacterium]|nr:hypothetical protein [Elusimicrobiota bacterium]
EEMTKRENQLIAEWVKKEKMFEEVKLELAKELKGLKDLLGEERIKWEEKLKEKDEEIHRLKQNLGLL